MNPMNPMNPMNTDGRLSRWADAARRDLRYAARVLRKNPGFALVAILSLALGIGANTAIFQLIHAVRLRNLPVARAEELAQVRIAGGNRGWGTTENENSEVTYPLWQQIHEHQRGFSGIFAWGRSGFLIGTGPDARPVNGLWVSGDAFSVLGVAPALGRLFGEADDRRGCEPTVVLSHAFWQAHFGGDPSAIGRTLTILDRPVAVIGVAPPEFYGLEVGKRFDIALPICAATAWGSPVDRRDWFWLSVMGRLGRGWTVARAADHLNALSPGIIEETLPSGYDAAGRDTYSRFRLTVLPAANGVSALRNQYGDALWLLLAMTALVLLIACTNLMNLMLARASAREQEIAVRVALGASRGRVLAQLIAESVVVAASGAVLGGALALPLSRGLLALLTTESDRLHLDLRLDWPILAFAAGVSGVTCLLFGLVPALRASQTNPGAAVKAGGRGLTASRDRLVVQRSLVAAQVAISLVLLFGAALFVRSFRNLTTLDTGLRREGVMFVRVADFSERPSPQRALAEQAELLEWIRSIPEVSSAAATTQFPLNGSSWAQGILVRAADGLQKRSSKFTYISGGYFTTLGMRIVTGRDVNDRDTANARKVALVNETFVRRYVAPADPLGTIVRTVAEPGFPEAVYEIVGVANDTKYADLREPIPPIAFVPIAQHPSLRPWPGIMIRSAAPTAALMAALKQAVGQRHPNMTMLFTGFDAQVRERLVRERVLAWLAGGFGLLAALLALIGVYGVISYLVVRRRHEIAIRLALGAGRTRLVWLILQEMIGLLTLGLAVGAGLAVAAARGTSGLLFGLSARDPTTLIGAASLLAAIGITATLVPAVRASRADAIAALRCE